ncbi:MAG: cupredoxin domain-containing protein [Chloroflexota bacterium]
MSRRLLLSALALLLLLAACGGASATPTPAPTVAPQPSIAASVAPAASAGAATPAASDEPDGPAASVAPAASGAAKTTVEVKLADYSFTPSAITVPAGEVTFVLDNTAGQEHEFEIFKGDAVVDEAEGLVPGLTREFVVTLAPGEYTYVCKLGGHDALGMKGTLTVTG